MRPITLNPALVPTITSASNERIQDTLSRVGRGAVHALRHLIFLPQVIVALPVLLALHLLDR